VVGQPFDLRGHPVAGEGFEGLDNVGMERPPPLQQEAAVRHLLGEGVLEGVGVLGQEPRLVEELRRLEVRQGTVQGVLGQLGHRVQQRERHVRANDRGYLEQALRLGRQPVDAGRQHGVDRLRQHPRRALFPGVPGQLLHKEGIASRLGHDRLELRLRKGHGTQRRLDDGPALRSTQGRHDDLRHRDVRRPSGLISRPIGREEQHGGLCHPLHQRRQPARRGGIAPVQVFDHQDEGPLLRGVQEQMPQQRKGPDLPPLGAALCQGLRGDWEVQELEQ
jgi:hypothetical protein